MSLVSDIKNKLYGDAVKKITDSTGVSYVVNKISEATGVDCGCDKRQEKLNEWGKKKNA